MNQEFNMKTFTLGFVLVPQVLVCLNENNMVLKELGQIPL